MAARRRRLTKVMAVAMGVVAVLGLAVGLGWAGASAEHYGLIWTSDARSWHPAQLLGPLVGLRRGTELAMLGWPGWFGAGYGEAVWGKPPAAAGQLVSLTLTTRMSVSSEEQQGDGRADQASISADGRFVAFCSRASNLVSGDKNGCADVFVRDRQTGTTERVSISSDGKEGNRESLRPSISADGRFVVFVSQANNLVKPSPQSNRDIFLRDRLTGQTELVRGPGGATGYSFEEPSISADGRFVAFSSFFPDLVPGDTNGLSDVFVRDRLTGNVERVSISSDGQQGNSSSREPSISANGRFVAFSSSANFVPEATYGRRNIFVHDRLNGKTELVSVSNDGQQGNADSEQPAISADGRFVAFVSKAWNLVPGDTNGCADVFVHDRQTGKTERVSVSSNGQQAIGSSGVPSISAGGRFVAFESGASNLVPGDTNSNPDVFVHDRQTGKTERVSISSYNQQANNASGCPSISALGRFVAFSSVASNLVPGDTNGYWDVFVRERLGPTETLPLPSKPVPRQG